MQVHQQVFLVLEGFGNWCEASSRIPRSIPVFTHTCDSKKLCMRWNLSEYYRSTDEEFFSHAAVKLCDTSPPIIQGFIG